MHDFIDDFTRPHPIPAVPSKSNVYPRIVSEFGRIVDWRRRQQYMMPSDHPLMILLHGLTGAIDFTRSDALDRVDARVEDLVLALNFTSLTNPGIVHRNICYGGYDEIVLIDTQDFDPQAMGRPGSWQNLQPIRVIEHPINDFILPLLNGKPGVLRGHGRVTLIIDPVLLAFQYGCWRKANPGLSSEVFMTTYPLTNLLASHIDLTIANRFFALSSNTPILEQDYRPPFYVNFYTDKLDPLLRDLNTAIRSQGFAFADILSVIPMLISRSYLDCIRLPDWPFVSQVEWAMALTRLPLIAWLVQYNASTRNTSNQAALNIFSRWIRRVHVGRYLQQGLSREQVNAVDSMIRRDILPYLNQSASPY